MLNPIQNNYTSMESDEQMDLPPGFRFHPTDEELITHYLSHKVLDTSFTAVAIGEADLNKVEPWDLPRRAKMGEKEWYFFCERDRKYPNGMRTNRATESGYWKATGKDKDIHKAKSLIGMKKTLVFYTGRAPRGEKSNWVMHEYRLEGIYSKSNLPKTAQNQWVLSRVFDKGPNEGPRFTTLLPPLMESSSSSRDHSIAINNNNNNNNPSHVTCFSNQGMMMSPLMEEDTADFQFLDSVFVEDKPFLKIIKGNSKVEFSPDIGSSGGCGGEMNNDTLSNCEMLQSCDGPIDLDFLWGY